MLGNTKKIFIRLIICSTALVIVSGIITFSFTHLQSQQLQQALATSIKTKVNLAIEGLSVGKSPTGLITVNGAVHNNSTMNVNNVEVKVELFANDKLVRETTRFVTPPTSIFEPEQMQQFRFSIIAEGVNHYNVTAYGVITS